MNVFKYQHHVCFNGVSKSCLSDSSDDRHATYNSYTDLFSIQLLLCRVVNCSPGHHLSRMFYF